MIENSLEGTVRLMLSEDALDRLQAEFMQVDIRIDMLEDFLQRAENGEPMMFPATPFDLLQMQLKVMKEYKAILLTRLTMMNLIDKEKRVEGDK